MTEHRGRVIVLNFWASWYVECRTETVALELLQREFSSRGLAIIGINARENKEVVARYDKELGLTFPLVFDRTHDQCPVRRHRASDDVRRRPGWARRRLCHRTSPVGECASPRAHRGAAGRAGPRSGRPMTAGRGVLLVLAIVLAIAGPMARATDAQSHRLAKIGAVTDSWGPCRPGPSPVSGVQTRQVHRSVSVRERERDEPQKHKEVGDLRAREAL